MSRGKSRPLVDAAAHMAAMDGKHDVRHPIYPTKIIMRRQDGRWWRHFDHLHEVVPGASKVNRRTTGETDWQAAVDAATRHYDAAVQANATGAAPHALTFRDAGGKFLAAQTAMIRKGGRTPQRVAFYAGRLARFINPYLGALPLPAVDTAACDAMLVKRAGATQHTHSQDVQIVRQVLGFARDVLRVKETIYLPKRVAPPDARRGAFTPAQFAALTAHISDPLLAGYVRVLGMTGMRAGEGLLLQFRDFGAFAPGGDPTYLHVPDGKEGRRDFYVLGGRDLADAVAALRAAHPKPNDPNARVFPHEYHHAFKAVLREMDALHPGQGWLADGEGNDLTVYSLRHMFITGMLVAGYTVDDVADMCGTSAAQIKKHYSHVTPAQKWARLRRQAAQAAA